MNKSLVTAGIPGGKYDLDVDAYEKLRNIQNYVMLSNTSFRNSCSFGLDTILGKMLSRAEQDIDSEFVTKFEAVVKDRDDHRPIFLKQAHSFRFGTRTR
jgi:hypothetical protein